MPVPFTMLFNQLQKCGMWCNRNTNLPMSTAFQSMPGSNLSYLRLDISLYRLLHSQNAIMVKLLSCYHFSATLSSVPIVMFLTSSHFKLFYCSFLSFPYCQSFYPYRVFNPNIQVQELFPISNPIFEDYFNFQKYFTRTVCLVKKNCL